ncbi:hypothetical protein [Ferrimonas marina]|uniref:Uncharacterized protein n=1 Tax=Ferrimonas marina TaxID=299255 RepID=A0A1M5U384_9GAMM|nr:hypothetical protein [Ferrimonas marina]SHH57320.1 hypothetical protein SAMN02745129_2384 [Ferrimonas marina]
MIATSRTRFNGYVKALFSALKPQSPSLCRRTVEQALSRAMFAVEHAVAIVHCKKCDQTPAQYFAALERPEDGRMLYRAFMAEVCESLTVVRHNLEDPRPWVLDEHNGWDDVDSQRTHALLWAEYGGGNLLPVLGLELDAGQLAKLAAGLQPHCPDMSVHALGGLLSFEPALDWLRFLRGDGYAEREVLLLACLAIEKDLLNAVEYEGRTDVALYTLMRCLREFEVDHQGHPLTKHLREILADPESTIAITPGRRLEAKRGDSVRADTSFAKELRAVTIRLEGPAGSYELAEFEWEDCHATGSARGSNKGSELNGICVEEALGIDIDDMGRPSDEDFDLYVATDVLETNLGRAFLDLADPYCIPPKFNFSVDLLRALNRDW